MRYWKRLNPDKSINTVEGYSHTLDVDGASEITEQEFNDFLASLPVSIPIPVRDLATEIDNLKAKVETLGREVTGLTGVGGLNGRILSRNTR